jgi:hypothetical protein
MAKGDYARFLEWAKAWNLGPEVKQGTDGRNAQWWSIGVTIMTPVSFSAYGRGPTVDDAAAIVIGQLETAGGFGKP